MSSIKGQIRKNLFVGDNGYYVSLFKLASDNESLNLEKDSTITITGYFNELNFNDIYELHGSMIEHPKYGLQFKSDSYIRLKPEGKDAIIEFLSSELFPGIGEKTAANIAEQFKEKTFETIINKPEDLYLIPRLSQKNIDTLHQVLKDYESSYQILVDLAELGFNTKDAVKINNYFKDEIKVLLKTNLYKLLDLKDLDFRKIDEIAIKNNYLIDDPRRVETVIVYAMKEVCFSLGHTYLKHNELYNYSKRAAMYDLSFEQFEECLASNIENLLIIKEGDKYYLKEIYEAEEYVSTRINYLLNKKELEYSNINKSYEKMSLASSIKFNKSQKQAIITSQKQNFTVITGGPGTGKTTIIKAIIELYQIYNSSSFQKLHKEIALLSPTGRASKRLSEATLMPASTIHRFLRWNKENDTFQLNERNKSDAKLVIIDESSMIDITLLSSLFKALRMDCRVIMVGDYEQLPSVGPGQILKDIIDTSLMPIVFLTELYRQASDSNIVKLAYGINTGAIDLTAQNDDLIFMDDSNILASISEIANKYKNVNYRDFQILVPIYKGAHGIDAINKIAQNIFNPASKNKKELSYFDKLYREGDKVLQLVNMPDENVYNGDLGLILNISPKEILIDFDGNLVSYSSADFKNFTLAYAISVHKAQGSEFKTVVLPVSFAYHKMLYRKLYYTAVSRAKETLYVVGDPRALKQASLNDKSDIRQSSLKDKLRNKYLI